MLNERSQTQKATECMVSFTSKIWDGQIHRDKKQMSGDQRLGEGGMRREGNGVGFLRGAGGVGDDENVEELDSDDSCTTL